jgi:hypothetical protein
VTTTVDTIKAVFTYATALVVVVGGGAAIFVSRADPAASDTVAIMAGFVGFALNFLFGSEVQTRTARQAAAATAAATGTNGHMEG